MAQTVGIRFKDGYDAAAIRRKAGELARLFELGSGPDDLLAALTSGRAQLVPLPEAAPDGTWAEISLTTLLEQCAAQLAATQPALAAELRRRAGLLAEAGI